LGHFNHRLSGKRGHESFETEAGRVDQVDTAMRCAKPLPSGRTSAPCGIATQTSNLELRGFLQLNNRQMPATGQVRHGQVETLATPPFAIDGRGYRPVGWGG